MASYLGNPIVHNLGMMLFVKSLTGAICSKNVCSATSMDQLLHHFAAHFMIAKDQGVFYPLGTNTIEDLGEKYASYAPI